MRFKRPRLLELLARAFFRPGDGRERESEKKYNNYNNNSAKHAIIYMSTRANTLATSQIGGDTFTLTAASVRF